MHSAEQKNFYNRPVAGQPVTSVIAQNIETPLLRVKFSNIVNPFFYPNSPTVPRYSITCVLEPDSHEQFIKKLIHIEKKEGIIDSQIFKDEIFKDTSGQVFKTGNHLIKFQNRERVPVTIVQEGEESLLESLITEIPPDNKVKVVFDIIRYSKRVPYGQPSKGISYQPKMIFLYSQEA